MIYDIPDWAFLPSFTFTNSAQNLFHTCILLAALHYHCHAPLLSLPPNAKKKTLSALVAPESIP